MSTSAMETCHYPDQDWVALLRSRPTYATPAEQAAAAAAVSCLWEKLFTFCVNRAAHYRQDEQVAQDAATCAYLRVRRAVDKAAGATGGYGGTGKFLHWCYRIAANCLNDLLRGIFGREQREVPLPDETDDE